MSHFIHFLRPLTCASWKKSRWKNLLVRPCIPDHLLSCTIELLSLATYKSLYTDGKQHHFKVISFLHVINNAKPRCCRSRNWPLSKNPWSAASIKMIQILKRTTTNGAVINTTTKLNQYQWQLRWEIEWTMPRHWPQHRSAWSWEHCPWKQQAMSLSWLMGGNYV